MSKRRQEHVMEMPSPAQEIDEEIITDADLAHLNSLFKKLSSLSLTDQKVAAKEIQQLTKQSPSSRALFGEITDGIQQLLGPLLGSADPDPELQEDLITTVFNLSIHDSNKNLFADSSLVILLLIESLRSGNTETRKYAAAAFFSLSALDSKNTTIGELGAPKPLISLLEDGNPLAMRDAASAIYNLCTTVKNQDMAVSAGAVEVIMQKLSAHILIDELLVILALLSSHQEAIKLMRDRGAVSCLLGILRENTSTELNKENCIAILYTMCCTDHAMLREISEEEDLNGTISQLVQSGTARAKREATGILERIKSTAGSD